MTRENSKQTETDTTPATEAELRANAEAIVKKANAEPKPKTPRKRKPAEKAKATEGVKSAFAPSPEGTPSSGPDPFDPSKFRYDPQHTENLTQRVFTQGQVTVRKPNDQEWFRVRPGPESQLPASILLLKHDKKYRLIAPAIAPAVRQAKPMVPRLWVTVGGSFIIWPVPMPAPDGRDFQYWESARGIATVAETLWMHMWANQDSGCYDSESAPADYGDPKWPLNLTLRDWLRLGFGKNGIIESLDHPDLQRLRGER